ncbi:hypothetical protein [Kribbella deserti]|uniref:Uncharacterized protein n=1 Tax=Kribbella deserti TaxID=1926257 RepID=A0ABV6QER6_9ACTN
MSRARVVVLLAAVAVVVVVCAVTWWDPFNLRYQGFLVAASTGLAVVSVATVAALVWRRRAIRIAAVVLGAVGLVFAGGTAWLAAELSPQGPAKDRVASPDGRYELVRVRGVVGSEVRLRRDRGLLSQETVVWYDDGGSRNGQDSGTVIPTFRFVDAHSVEVTTSDTCIHRSPFNRKTLLLLDSARPFRSSTC